MFPTDYVWQCCCSAPWKASALHQQNVSGCDRRLLVFVIVSEALSRLTPTNDTPDKRSAAFHIVAEYSVCMCLFCGTLVPTLLGFILGFLHLLAKPHPTCRSPTEGAVGGGREERSIRDASEAASGAFHHSHLSVRLSLSLISVTPTSPFRHREGSTCPRAAPLCRTALNGLRSRAF